MILDAPHVYILLPCCSPYRIKWSWVGTLFPFPSGNFSVQFPKEISASLDFEMAEHELLVSNH